MLKMTPEIEALLAQKPYTALTEREMELVESHGGRSAYEAMRETILAAQQLSEAPAPPPQLQGRLQAAFRSAFQKRNVPLSVVQLPFWQAAAVTALLLLAGQALRMGPAYASAPAFALQAQDSVWLERLTTIVHDTAAFVFPPEGDAWEPATASAASHVLPKKLQTAYLKREPAVDTPGWAKRAAIGGMPLLLSSMALH